MNNFEEPPPPWYRMILYRFNKKVKNIITSFIDRCVYRFIAIVLNPYGWKKCNNPYPLMRRAFAPNVTVDSDTIVRHIWVWHVSDGTGVANTKFVYICNFNRSFHYWCSCENPESEDNRIVHTYKTKEQFDGPYNTYLEGLKGSTDAGIDLNI